MEDVNSRLGAVDLLRGLAAFSVAVYHYNAGPALARATGCSWLHILNMPGSSWAVPILVAISGFCIHLGWINRRGNAWSTRAFFISRFWRIYPAWLVAVLFSALLLLASGQTPSLRVLITHLTLTNGFFNDYSLNPVLWTVSLEACLYLLYPLWLTWRIRYGLIRAVQLAAVVSLTSTTVIAFLFEEPMGSSIWFFGNVWIGWVGGAFLAESWFADDKSRFQQPAWWLCGVGLLLLCIALPQHGPMCFFRMPLQIITCLWPISLALLAGRLIAAAPGIIRTSWNTFVGLGCFSYSLYLLHMPFIGLRLKLEAGLPMTLPVKTGLYCLWFLLILFMSRLSYQWLERPSMELGRRIINRVRHSATSLT